MKKVRIISLLLVLCLVMSLVYPLPAKAAEENGMVINKTAKANDDGTYTIQLEAYATGSKIITEISKDKPTDIVLVLDESGSMAYCIECGNEMDGWYDTHNTYTVVDANEISQNDEYFIKDGTRYIGVSYCSGTHYSWGGSTHCSGAGWYTGDWSNEHTVADRKDPAQVQFYAATQVACSSRINALKEAAENFVNEVQRKALGSDTTSTSDDVAHRIAVVGFASNASNLTRGFKDMKDSDDVKDVLKVIENLSANGGTQVDDGIRIANDIFAANQIPADSDRQRVLIVFTDGAPGEQGNWGQGSVNTANAAISAANAAKNTHKATVYTVGIFSGADASSPDSLPAYTSYEYGNMSEADQINNSNRFMHLVSSNYPNPTNIQTPGTSNSQLKGSSYYLSAGDAETLNSIFQQISDQIESGNSSSTLTSASVVKDIIAPGFKLPAGASADNITLETFKCTGKSNGEYTWTKNDDTMGAKATVNGDTVDVTGFDFSKNYVAEVKTNGVVTDYMGHKLVITFTVERKSEYLGGNGVETNASAGIYENADAEEPIVTFPKPVVNVPINQVVVTNADDQNVYLYDTLTGADLMGDASVKVGDVVLKLNETNYGIEEWQNKDVNILVEITDKDSKAVTDETFKNLTADSKYNVKVTVSPKNDVAADKPERGPAATAKYGEDDAEINVFKPEITWQDSQINAGETPDYVGTNPDIEDNFVNVVWKHGTTLSTEKDNDENSIMDTTEPALSYDFDPKAESISVDTPVDVTVLVGTGEEKTNITSHVTFVHENCDFDGCKWQDPQNAGKEFIVHIKSFDLTIYKTGVAAEDGDAPFIVNVKCDATKIDMDVVLYGEDQVTIKGLPSGTYTITETSGYWRYDLTQAVYKNADGSVNNTREVKPSGATASITIENRRTNDKCLDDWAKATNNFGGSAIKDSGIADN